MGLLLRFSFCEAYVTCGVDANVRANDDNTLRAAEMAVKQKHDGCHGG